MPQAFRTAAANDDLRQIARYIAVHEKRPDTAFDAIDQMIAKCDLLGQSPLIGTARPELGAGYRVFSHKRWVIIFRPIRDGIEVMRIVDGARDYDRLF